ncbi:hypothetical protein K435DRAFT_806021 [Dendrothele bispora CBS 962.96]|uniref:Uncharacterized protein n=1 Tax=Dendrothele bispora (strain CBS 962.96) TaxID=1314807 RepID=A0A4S8L968_DENBC|nr:hypothetical protein K435DRAFT_806021 [Dendrothele bispora CBS 962.96]
MAPTSTDSNSTLGGVTVVLVLFKKPNEKWTTVTEYVMKVWVEGMPSPLCLPQCPGYALIPTRHHRRPSPSATHYSLSVTSISSVIAVSILISLQQHRSAGGQAWFKNFVPDHSGNMREHGHVSVSVLNMTWILCF